MNPAVPEVFRVKVRDASIRFWTAGIISLSGAFAREIPSVRDRLPEPVDFFSHVGNINGSVLLGYVAGLAGGRIYEATGPIGNESTVRKHARIAMAAGGLAAGVIINTLAESKFGMNFLHVGTTSDAVDFAYGTLSATAAGALLPEVTTEAIIEPESVEEI